MLGSTIQVEESQEFPRIVFPTVFRYSQGCGRLEFIEALKLRDWAEVCSQSQDTRSAVIGGAQNS